MTTMTPRIAEVAFELVAVPPAHIDAHRYAHVIGSSIFAADVPADESWPRHFVGVLDGQALFAVDVPDGEDPSDGALVDLRRFFGMVDESTWMAAGRAVQVVEWSRTHRFCGRCAEPTVRSERFMAMECPRCRLVAFPRVSPAMITLVTKGPDGVDQQALLARGVGWPASPFPADSSTSGDTSREGRRHTRRGLTSSALEAIPCIWWTRRPVCRSATRQPHPA